MKKIVPFILASASLLGNGTPSYLPQNGAGCVEEETPSTVTVRHREHEGVGYKTGYTTLDVFFTPNWVRNFQPFMNVRGHVMNDGKFAANLGLGVRGAPIEKLAIGGNFFFDYREVSGMPAYQLGSGLEILSPYVDLRVNGYLPVGHKNKTYDAAFSRFTGNNAFLKERFKAELATVYGEVGAPIPWMPDNFQIYVAAGPYYIGKRHVDLVNKRKIKVGDKWGGKYRLAARIYDYFEAGVELTHDSLFHTNVQGYMGVTLPLGPSKMYRGFKKSGQNCSSSRKFRRMMAQPVIRNEIIPIIDQTRSNIIATASDGDTIDFIFVNLSAPAGGDGSFERPFQNLFEAQAGSGPGDYIIVFEGGGIYTDEFITLQQSQSFYGAASSFVVDGVTIGPFDGSVPILDFTDNVSEFMVRLAENTHVEGFTFQFTGGGTPPTTIIDAGQVGTFSIVDNDIQGGLQYGISGGIGGNMASGTKRMINNFIGPNGASSTLDEVAQIYLLNAAGDVIISGGRLSVPTSTSGPDRIRAAVHYDTSGNSGDRSLTIENLSIIGTNSGTIVDAPLIDIRPIDPVDAGTLTVLIDNVNAFSSARANIGIRITGQTTTGNYTITNSSFTGLESPGGGVNQADGLRFLSSLSGNGVQAVINLSNNTFDNFDPIDAALTITNNTNDVVCATLSGTVVNDLIPDNTAGNDFLLKSPAGTQGSFEAENPAVINFIYTPGAGSFTFTTLGAACPDP